MNDRSKEMLAGALFILLGLFFFINSIGMTLMNAIYPRTLCVLMILLGAVIGVQAYRKEDSSKEEKDMDYKRVFASILTLIIYLLVLEKLGFIISTTLMVFLIPTMLGYKNVKVKLLTGIILSLTIYLVFGKLLSVHLPKGILYFI